MTIKNRLTKAEKATTKPADLPLWAEQQPNQKTAPEECYPGRVDSVGWGAILSAPLRAALLCKSGCPQAGRRNKSITFQE